MHTAQRQISIRICAVGSECLLDTIWRTSKAKFCYVDNEASNQTTWMRLLIRFFFALRKHAYTNIQKISPPKTENFHIKKLRYFSYFCSKRRLWVLVRTASERRFERVPTIYVLSRNKKNNVYPCKPQFYYIKVGFKGV